MLCRDGEFEQLPEYIRKRAPGQVMRRGEVTKLNRNYCRRLARDGYALVYSKLAVFNPEA